MLPFPSTVIYLFPYTMPFVPFSRGVSAAAKAFCELLLFCVQASFRNETTCPNHFCLFRTTVNFGRYDGGLSSTARQPVFFFGNPSSFHLTSDFWGFWGKISAISFVISHIRRTFSRDWPRRFLFAHIYHLRLWSLLFYRAIFCWPV